MSPTIAECQSTPANASGTRLGPTMKRTANSSFGRPRIGRSWPLRKSWKFGPLRERLRKSLGRPLPEPTKCSGLHHRSLYVLLRHDEGRNPQIRHRLRT